MILFGGALGLLALGVWIFCIIDAITTPADQVRTLPKLAWVLIVILLIDIGSVAWLIAGRPWNAKTPTPGGTARSGSGGASGFTTSATSRRRTPSRPLSPDDDDEWLASLPKPTDPRRDDGPQGPAPTG